MSAQTASRAKPPVLGEAEVHVWVARVGSQGSRDSRAILRELLAGYLGADAQSLRFQSGEHGKPELADVERSLRFNVSHSGTLCLYAVARGVELGVDVELPGRRGSFLGAARRAFGEDVRERLAQLEEPRRERAFLELWTLHEARLKCAGVGLARGAGERASDRCWSTRLDVGESAVAALACSQAPARVRVWPR